MNPALKKICLYSLCDSIGAIINEQSENEALKWRGLKLHEAGEHAMFKSNVKIDKSRMGQASRKINEIHKDGEEVDVLESLLFLLCGLSDLDYHGADPVMIEVLIRRLNWTIVAFDSRLDNNDMYDQAVEEYEKWAS